jgi:MFS family permease
MTILLTAFMKKINPILNIAIAGILFAVGFGMLYYSRIFVVFIISTFIWTFGEIINAVNSNVLIANYSPVTHRGRFNAVIFFISGIGFTVGPLLSGLYIRYFGIRNIWPLNFLLAVLASMLMLMLFFIEKIRKPAMDANKL